MGIPERRRLPDTRKSVTHKFKIEDKAMGTVTVFATVGLYEDGTPGELFVNIGKLGTTLNAMVAAFAIGISFGLQYGIPLDVYVHRFEAMRFEPMGKTSNPDIPVCTSIVDYLAQWMKKEFSDA